MKKIIVCDYNNPNNYTFPNFDMGSSEKRIWHFAKTASELEKYEVIITGPMWLPEYVPNAKYFPKQLNSHTYQEFLSIYGKCDFLFAGHEYFDKDEWVVPFENCANSLLSYQLHPYEYKKKSFNGKDKILFCYSDEMVETYKEQKPVKALLFHNGVNEDPYFVEKPQEYLVWLGRLDKEKAPHYAIIAAGLLDMPVYILGKTVYQPEYYEEYKAMFDLPHVNLLGFKTGQEKMDVIANAKCAIYTVDKSFSEAGAGVLGEILSCGVPIAGITWTGNDAVCEAVESNLLGKIVDVSSLLESEVAQNLSEAIRYCLKLDRNIVYELGSKKYNPYILVENILLIAEKASTKNIE